MQYHVTYPVKVAKTPTIKGLQRTMNFLNLHCDSFKNQVRIWNPIKHYVCHSLVVLRKMFQVYLHLYNSNSLYNSKPLKNHIQICLSYRYKNIRFFILCIIPKQNAPSLNEIFLDLIIHCFLSRLPSSYFIF